MNEAAEAHIVRVIVEQCALIAEERSALRGDGEYALGASDMATEIAEAIRELAVSYTDFTLRKTIKEG